MGKVTWGAGISGSDIDNAERSAFKPYDGPLPPNQLFAWKITQLVKGKSNSGNPSLRIGLELVPRQSRPDDKPYKGYRITDFIPVMESTTWRLAPFLDAIGVTGADFVERTFTDKDGNIEKIGKVVFKGKTVYVMAMLADNDGQNSAKYPKQIAPGQYWMPEGGAAASAGRGRQTEPEPDDSADDDADADGDGYDGADDDPPF